MDEINLYLNGANRGWRNFAQDFGEFTADYGGGAPYTKPSLTNDGNAQADWKASFVDMAAHGIQLVRFWIFPEIWAVDFNGTQAIANPSLNDDICTILRLASEAGIMLQPTIISFDAFKKRGNSACPDSRISTPNGTSGGAPDSYKSAHEIFQAGDWPLFCSRIVGPMAAAAEACPHRSALHSWDLFNEPDQVVRRQSNTPLSAYVHNAGTGILTNNQDFDANNSGSIQSNTNCYDRLDIVEMRQFIEPILNEVKANSTAPITIGTNTKWHYSFLPNKSTLPGDVDLPIDFVSLHTYSWQEPHFPTYTVRPEFLHSTGLPTMIGEYPPANSGSGQSIGDHDDVMQGYYDNGYFGHLSWQYGEGSFGFSETSLDEQLVFSQSNDLNITIGIPNPQPSGCILPLTFRAGTASTRCLLPLEFNNGCELPLVFIGAPVDLVVADCINCPQAIDKPRISAPYGSELTLDPAGFFEFPVDTLIDVQYFAINGALSGDISRDNGILTYRPPPAAGACDVECGSISVGFSYICPRTSTGVGNCVLEIDVCSFPAATTLGDETITVFSGQYPVINAEPGDEPEVLNGPPVGSLAWNGAGWEFRYPEGFVGRIEVVVPTGAGDKAGFRCITLCVEGGQVTEVDTDACSVLAVRDKTGSYRPVAEIINASLQISSERESEVSWETGQLFLPPSSGLRWTMSATLKLTCGDNPFQVGSDADIVLLKDARIHNGPRFFGTAHVQNLATQLGSRDQKTASISLQGHGGFYALKWAI